MVKFSLPMHEEDRQKLYAAAELEQRNVHKWARKLLLDAAYQILEQNERSITRDVEPKFIPPRVVTSPGASLSDKLEQSFNAPAPPWNLPAGSEYLAAANMWRTPAGNLWDQNGPIGEAYA